MSTKISYYPGCTLKTKARHLEAAALASLAALGIEVEELERWNCCGAVFSLTDDDLLHQLAPVRDLIRAKDAGAGRVVTLCSQCYNTLARANLLMRQDEQKRKTLNDFMTEETDYFGELEVVHFLDLLRMELGWDGLRQRVKRPLAGLRVATFYGCTLIRPADVALGGRALAPTIMHEFLAALGATPVDFAGATDCCGSYQGLANPAAALSQSSRVLLSARGAGADALVLSCPLCDYNLGQRQSEICALRADFDALPVYYFSQLLALALGLGPEACSFELNSDSARALLKQRAFLGEATV